MTDAEIASASGFYDVLQEGNIVMFDKGATGMREKIKAKGADLITPSYVMAKYLACGEIRHSRLVSSARVHIERLNERIKRFRWLDTVLSPSGFGTVSTKWRVCVWLTNFMGPPTRDGGASLFSAA